MSITITILDPVECQISQADAQLILPALTIREAIWRPVKKWGKIVRQRYEYDREMFSYKRSHAEYWRFYSGFLRRVTNYCTANKIEFSVIDEYGLSPNDFVHVEPELDGIVFREDQKKLLDKIFTMHTGVIKSPTGSGKTIIELGLISAYPKANALILSHTLDIVKQTTEELERFGFSWETQTFPNKDGGKGELACRLVISTIQSFCKRNPAEYADYFDIVIIDEGHHVSDFKGMYGKVLSHLLAPIRIAFTATTYKKKKPKHVLEGLIGPVIGKLTVTEAIDKRIIAKPIIRLVKTEKDPEVRKTRTFAAAYDRGIVFNLKRNQKIVKIAKDLAEQGQSSLIIVNKIAHGNEIKDIAKKLYNRYIPFVEGATSTEKRIDVKKALIDKKVKVVICTTIWKEGVNIPSLDNIINAAGGKSEIATLQSIGRGLRRTEDKSTVKIWDFFDPSHPYLIAHFGERITLYFEEGWM